MYNLLKIIYNLIIALFLLFLVMFGINVFYPQPQLPSYTWAEVCAPCPLSDVKSSALTCPCSNNYQNIYAKYQSDLKMYQIYVSIISLIFSMIFLALGVFLFYKLPNFFIGPLFGSLFTFIYSLTNVIASGSTILQFVIVLIGFIICLIIGYIFFTKREKKFIIHEYSK